VSKGRAWMPFFIGDWEKSQDVELMPPEAEACYFVLIRKCWLSKDGGIPDDDTSIKTLLGKFSVWWELASKYVRPKFQEKNGRLYNQKILDELAEMKSISQKRRVSARKRWGKKNASAYAIALQVHSKSNATHTKEDRTTPPQKAGGGTQDQPQNTTRRWDGYL